MSGFPTPEGWGEDEPEPEPETRTGEPTFGDDMTEAELTAAIREYQEWCSEYYPVEIDLDGVTIDISRKLKRTAGFVRSKKGTGHVKMIRYAWKAYQKWGWEKFAETIRHELIHVHTVQNYQEGGHGRRFKRMVEPMDTTRHCESFAEDEAKYHIYCTGCGELTGRKFRECKTVNQPERYRTRCCKANLRVEEQ